jgi:drug/metabolite transporter (DMT)-like permease
VNWLLVTLLCALFTALSDAISKRVVRDNDEWLVGAITLGLADLALFPFFLASPRSSLDASIWGILLIALPLEALGYFCFLSALRQAPLSLTLPLLAFTPVFTLLTGRIILDERISPMGALGVFLVAAGAYLLNADLVKVSVWAPIREVFSRKGPRLMLLAAAIWAVTAVVGKKGVLLFGSLPFGFIMTAATGAVFGLVALGRRMRGTLVWNFRGPNLWFVLLGGASMAGAAATHFYAVSMAPVALMIAVKRLSLVFGVLLGWIMFREEKVLYRLAATMVMVSGVLVMYS